jgi:hypothetical protein
VCRHRAEGDRVVPNTGKVLVGGPIVGDQPGLRGNRTEHEGMELVFVKPRDHLQPGPPRLAAVDFNRAATSILPTPLRPAGTTTGSFSVRNGMIVSSASTRPLSGSRSGLTMVRRSLAPNIQAVPVGAQAELVLQLQRRDAVGVRRHQKTPPRTRSSAATCWHA